ncbi:SRPBCC family protein [Rufibacter latericius]|uniref:Polyketide cyclase n=1 Tax=Rufibacter latericius TaxID=2487040 RepID=A0A3M9MTY1_9BACT|nr:SRPBCC family protein [Rufibacter latericius]RNI28980.1 polyketide cyclase [Rufibacter latericius]
MILLKKVLLGAALLVAALLVGALFVSREYHIEREIVINQPKDQVFNYIKHLKNQDYYSKWVMKDPEMKKSFRGTDGSVGFVYAWDGNDDAGKGEQEIKNIVPGEKLDIEIRFQKPMEVNARTPFTTTAVSENQTKVTWGMSGGNPYPFNLMHLIMDPLLGKDIETSLITLKGILEKEQLTSN